MTTFKPLAPYFATFNVTDADLTKAAAKFDEKYGAGAYDREIKRYVEDGIMSIFNARAMEEETFFVVECVTPVVNERLSAAHAEKERTETPVYSAAEYAALQAERDAAVKLAEANAAEVKRLTDEMEVVWREAEAGSRAESYAAMCLGHKPACAALLLSDKSLCDCGGIEPT